MPHSAADVRQCSVAATANLVDMSDFRVSVCALALLHTDPTIIFMHPDTMQSMRASLSRLPVYFLLPWSLMLCLYVCVYACVYVVHVRMCECVCLHVCCDVYGMNVCEDWYVCVHVCM